jgi:hypothetical protein
VFKSETRGTLPVGSAALSHGSWKDGIKIPLYGQIAQLFVHIDTTTHDNAQQIAT